MLTSSILVQETELIYQKRPKIRGFFFIFVQTNSLKFLAQQHSSAELPATWIIIS